MSYEVIARKWRPQRFSELVGQDHISRTLKNAISRGRVAHAYLFVGSRGVGKTTSARLFAKSLNCTNLIDGEPCCRCQSCLEITNGNSLDVIEIDGASNNGVDNIRDLRENVQYTPVTGNYKIYIIDEVHMLSTSAWNALLKTLEEPPGHVKFIFATTEVHKVLPTVISRCQRFDFKSIPPVLIVQKLRQIADVEQIFITDEALAAVARVADGGMRDAQSIFDQLIAFCGGGSADETIQEHDVSEVFGLVAQSELYALVSAMYCDDMSGLMTAVNRFAATGRDLDRLLADLLVLLRNLMLVQSCSNGFDLLEVADHERAELEKMALQPAHLTRVFLDELMQIEGRMRSALNKRVFLEVGLVRALRAAHEVDLDTVIQQFQHLAAGTLPRPQLPTQALPAAVDTLHEAIPQPPSVGTDVAVENLPSAEKKSEPQSEVSLNPPVATSVTSEDDQSKLTACLSEDELDRIRKEQFPDTTDSDSNGSLSGISTDEQLDESPSTSPSSADLSTIDPVTAKQEPIDTQSPGTITDGSNSVVRETVAVKTTSKDFAETPFDDIPDDFLTPQAVEPDSSYAEDVSYEPIRPVSQTTNTGEPSYVASSFSDDSAVDFTVQPINEESPFLDSYTEVANETDHFEVINTTDGAFFPEDEISNVTEAVEPITSEFKVVPEAPMEQAVDTSDLSSLWGHFETAVSKVEGCGMLGLYLRELRPLSYENGALTALFTDDFPDSNYNLLVQADNQKRLNQVLVRLLERKDARFILQRGHDEFGDADRSLTATPEVMQRVSDNAFIQSVLGAFQGDLIDVRG